MMDGAKSETLKNFTILNKGLLFLIKSKFTGSHKKCSSFVFDYSCYLHNTITIEKHFQHHYCILVKKTWSTVAGKLLEM